MVLESYLEDTKRLVKARNKLESDILQDKETKIIEQEKLTELQRPTILAIENKLEQKEIEPDYKNIPEIDYDNDLKYRIELNPVDGLSNTVMAINSTMIMGKHTWPTIKINGNDLVIRKFDKEYYLHNTNKSKLYVFNYNLKLLLEGRGDKNNPEVQNYLQILKDVNADRKSNYVKSLKNKVKIEEIEGTGIKFMPDNSLMLFMELRKLLAAKKAGNTNTYNEINAILKRLLELKSITTEKYKKILNKYF